MKQGSSQAAIAAASILLAFAVGCKVGPAYQRPAAMAASVAPSIAWKGEAPWREAAPKDGIPRGEWWKVFQDQVLDTSEQQLLKQNQSLQAAQSRLQQARSQVRAVTSGLFPQFSAYPSAMRDRASGNYGPAGTPLPSSPGTGYNYTVPFSISYEVDLFGSEHRKVEAANAGLQSTAADLENSRLVLTAELAADYFTLRALDAQLQLFEETVGYERKGLELVNNRHKIGIASALDVAQQTSLLDATLTQVTLTKQSRAQYVNAIAVLVGQSASSFSVEAAPLHATPPPVPLGVPSDLLERRPDIASAERQVAAANAQVGLARSAFYPNINLFGSGGVESESIATLFNAPSFIWSLGVGLAQPILQGGRNTANLEAAQAAYDTAVANYRQSVLTAFQQVEDGINNLQMLSQATVSQAAAVEDARRELEIANNRYIGGVATYLDVINAQSTLLANERQQTQLLGQQMVSAVYLVKALGGGWDAAALSQEQVRPGVKQIIQP